MRKILTCDHIVTYCHVMEEIFKALADPTRRLLLDRLLTGDEQTLGELADGLNMSRFGVMKHLNVLETAGLIHTRRMGRVKLHSLSAAPIQQVHDQWFAQYVDHSVA